MVNKKDIKSHVTLIPASYEVTSKNKMEVVYLEKKIKFEIVDFVKLKILIQGTNNIFAVFICYLMHMKCSKIDAGLLKTIEPFSTNEM